MPDNGIYSWSATTPLDNGNADSNINWLENQAPSTVNNSARAMMQRLAQYLDDQGYPAPGGTANALTLTPGNVLTSYATGMHYTFTAASSNTGATTLNVSALGAKAIRKISAGTDVALIGGDIAAGSKYLVIYDAAANGAAGAWILTAPSAIESLTLTSTDAGATAGPILTMDRNSASPAASDILGRHAYRGRDSAAASVDYAYVQASIIDPSTANGSSGALSIFVKDFNSATQVEAIKVSGRQNPGVPTGRQVDIAADVVIGSAGASTGFIGAYGGIYVNSGGDLLDAYDEGTWTVVYAAGGASTGVTYSSRTGTYTKIGERVIGEFRFVLSSKGSATGNVTITGLPFSTAQRGGCGIGAAGSFTGLTGALVGNIAEGNTIITLRQSSAAGNASVTDASVTGSADLSMSFAYGV